jgi:aquaporin TIP
MRDAIRHFVAEFVGIFALVFVGGAALILSQANDSGIGLLEIAIAHGLTLSIMVTATMRVSGHLNPAVTFAFLAARRIEPIMAGVYIIAQVSGAIVAAYALSALLPSPLVDAARVGGQSVALSITGTQAWVLEAIATFFLVFVVFGTAVDPEAPKVGGFAIGLTVTIGILAIGPLTGGSMNPARSLGPAIVSGIYEAQLIYWTAPIAGGLVAGLLYDLLFLRRRPDPIDHGAVRPTTDEPDAVVVTRRTR